MWTARSSLSWPFAEADSRPQLNKNRNVSARPGQHDARAPDGSRLYFQRRLKNFLQQIAIVDFRRSSGPQTLAFVQQHDAVGKLRGEVQLVRDDEDGVAIVMPPGDASVRKRSNLPPISRCCVGSSRRRSEGCCASARARITRCFSPPESSSIQRSRRARRPLAPARSRRADDLPRIQIAALP